MGILKNNSDRPLRIAATLILVSSLCLAVFHPPPDSAGSGRKGGDEPVAALSGSTGTEKGGIPVLCYHYLRGRTGPIRFFRILGALVLNLPLLSDTEIWTVSAGAFEKQMDHLQRAGYRVVGLDDLVAWQEGLLDLPSKSVVITFDDADRSVYEYAYPVLERYGFRASIFVVTSHVGDDDWEGVEVLSWGELKELYDSGLFSIESHTHSLHYKVRVGNERLPVFKALLMGECELDGFASGEEAIISDLEESREIIRERIGAEAQFLSWPYGFGDEELDALALLAGFEGLCTLGAGLNQKTWTPGKVGTELARGGLFQASFDRCFPDVEREWVFPGAVGGVNPGLSGFEPSRALPSAVGGGKTNRKAAIKRFTVTARTSLRVFKQMVSGDPDDVER